MLLATEKLTVPFPEPLDPDVICTKLSVDTAFQLQVPDAVTLKLPVAAAFVKFWEFELSEVTQVLASKNGAIFG